jgi:hypothetical protein
MSTSGFVWASVGTQKTTAKSTLMDRHPKLTFVLVEKTSAITTSRGESVWGMCGLGNATSLSARQSVRQSRQGFFRGDSHCSSEHFRAVGLFSIACVYLDGMCAGTHSVIRAGCHGNALTSACACVRSTPTKGIVNLTSRRAKNSVRDGKERKMLENRWWLQRRFDDSTFVVCVN